jgi:uncharacterized membrane protein YjjP (DUF1212 family)
VAVTGTDEQEAQEVRTVLVHLGTAMVATGQPINEVEDELAEVALALGHPDAQIAAGPTGVTLSLASGAPSTYEGVTGALRLDQAAQVRGIRRDLLLGRVAAAPAVEQLLALRGQPARYPVWLANLGWVATATGIALILQPGWRNVALSALASVVVVGLFRLAQRFRLLSTLLPVVAAFVVACLVFAAADLGLVEGPLRTLLPPLAVLLPGALIVTAMAELAAGDMIAGSSRLTFGLVQVLPSSAGGRPPSAWSSSAWASGCSSHRRCACCPGSCWSSCSPSARRRWASTPRARSSAASSGRSRPAPARTWSRRSCRTCPGSWCSCRPSGCSCRAASASSGPPSSPSTPAGPPRRSSACSPW